MSKQKFNGKTLYTKTLVDNIMHVAKTWGQPVDTDWYFEAFKFAMELSVVYRTDINKCIGVIASLSPQKNWIENKKLASGFLAGQHRGHTRAMLDKAQQIVESNGKSEVIIDILNGNKIKAFYLNILHFDIRTTVTVDKHAIDIALHDVKGKRQLTTKQYIFFEHAYILASIKMGLLPHELQAMTWVGWRKAKRQYGIETLKTNKS